VVLHVVIRNLLRLYFRHTTGTKIAIPKILFNIQWDFSSVRLSTRTQGMTYTQRCFSQTITAVTISCLHRSVLCISMKYIKTSLIRTNLELTLVEISESPNYRSATENMFREAIKWACKCLFRQYNFSLKLRLNIIKLIYFS
jgi:hypothetical protein